MAQPCGFPGLTKVGKKWANGQKKWAKTTFSQIFNHKKSLKK